MHYGEPVCQPRGMKKEHVRNATLLLQVDVVKPGSVCSQRCPWQVDWENLQSEVDS